MGLPPCRAAGRAGVGEGWEWGGARVVGRGGDGVGVREWGGAGGGEGVGAGNGEGIRVGMWADG